jgi:thiamine biosynthesis lipoprotein ApbE
MPDLHCDIFPIKRCIVNGAVTSLNTVRDEKCGAIAEQTKKATQRRQIETSMMTGLSELSKINHRTACSELVR